MPNLPLPPCVRGRQRTRADYATSALAMLYRGHPIPPSDGRPISYLYEVCGVSGAGQQFPFQEFQETQAGRLNVKLVGHEPFSPSSLLPRKSSTYICQRTPSAMHVSLDHVRKGQNRGCDAKLRVSGRREAAMPMWGSVLTSSPPPFKLKPPLQPYMYPAVTSTYHWEEKSTSQPTPSIIKRVSLRAAQRSHWLKAVTAWLKQS